MNYQPYIVFLLAFFLLWNLPAIAQVNEDVAQYKLLRTIEVDAKFIRTDKLQNVFVVNKKGEVIKYTPKGDEMARYNEFSLGTPSQLDATNPFQILVFYPDYASVITLDNTMSKISTYDLFDLGLDFINNICFSNDGRIWLYDATTFQLKKIDPNGNILLKGSELSMILNRELSPNFLLERNNRVFVNDPEIGILMFDLYGQFDKILPVKGLKSFQVLGNQLIYFKEGRLLSFHLDALTTQPIVLPDFVKENDFVRIEKGRLFVAGEERLSIYTY